MKFKIKGKPDKISIQEIRSILYSTDVILSFHNKHPLNDEISVLFTNEDLGIAEKSKNKAKAIGVCNWRECWMKIKKNLPYSTMITTLVHEMIHIYFKFKNIETEKLTSTLTAKFLLIISEISNILVEGMMKRAAHIAHLKISYKPENEDYYDSNENKALFYESKGKKFRKNKEEHTTKELLANKLRKRKKQIDKKTNEKLQNLNNICLKIMDNNIRISTINENTIEVYWID